MGVIIINQGWTDNLGDVAIGKTLKKELKDFHPLELQFAPIKMCIRDSVWPITILT